MRFEDPQGFPRVEFGLNPSQFSFERDLPSGEKIERHTYCANCGLRCDSEKERVDHVKEYGAKHNDFEITETSYDSDGNLTSMEKIAGGLIAQLPEGVKAKDVYKI